MAEAVINGAKIWYETSGKGEPILLHHGYTASRVNWAPVAKILEQHYQVIMMECRGTGASEHTVDGYSLQQYALDVIGPYDIQCVLLQRISIYRMFTGASPPALHHDDLVMLLEDLCHRSPVDSRSRVAMVKENRFTLSARLVPNLGTVYHCFRHGCILIRSIVVFK